jgi:hypothetical protein
MSEPDNVIDPSSRMSECESVLVSRVVDGHVCPSLAKLRHTVLVQYGMYQVPGTRSRRIILRYQVPAGSVYAILYEGDVCHLPVGRR